jgi:MFS family permease
MINKIKQNKYISAGAAFTSVLAMWLVYYLGTKAPAHIELFIFGVGVILLLSTLLPAIYVKLYEQGDLSDLGIHARRIKLLMGISAFFGLGSLFYYFELANGNNINNGEALRFLLWSLLALWEVIFVFGWLQIRYEKAFGSVAGIILAGLSFALYHLGTAPLDQIITLAAVGVFGAVLFKLAGNSIFVLWPFFWGVGVAIGALQGSATIEVSSVSLISMIILLLLQVTFFAYWFKYRHRK